MQFKKVATLLGAGVVIAGAAAGSAVALPMGATQANSAKASTAGQPTPTSVLLCGYYAPGADRISGASNIDHPNGASSTGSYYTYNNDNCEAHYAPGGMGFAGGTGTYTWTIGHSNVNMATERGTEHGQATLDSTTSTFLNGFNGRVTNDDLTPADPAGDPCTADSSGRTFYYHSGHEFDTDCSPAAPGNFNTHGGAATGNHFNGKYQSVVYQDPSGDTASPCQSGSANYCFEAIIIGQQN